MKQKLKTGSYCFLDTLAFQEAKSKARRKQLTTLRSYISERFYFNSPFVFAVYKAPLRVRVCLVAWGFCPHPKMGF
jgi:hypothetical protein